MKLGYPGSLHNHTEYSNLRLRDSINKAEDMINYAIELGHEVIAITEHESVSNAIKVEKHYNKKIDKDNVKLKENLYFNKDKEFIWPNLNNGINNTKGTCYGTRTHIGILSDGTVIPCCLDSSGIINLGNIFETSLKEIIESKRFINIKTNFQNNKICEELCKKCGFINR